MSNRILIDPSAFATQNEVLHGTVALQDLDERVRPQDIVDQSTHIKYTLQGGCDRWQRLFLDLAISGELNLQCQRCMQPMNFHLNETAHIVLFENEQLLDKAMLADDDLEGMVTEAELDVYTLIEDQILMALPFSPKHEDCCSNDLSSTQIKPNPFAVLAGLNKNG